MMDPRPRSESPLVGDFRSSAKKGLDQPCPLFNANNARRKAEQDSILLANRIRLLRAEEEKARKKIRETESKTKEIIDLRRRGEEKRHAREAEDARKEALEQELRARAVKEREDNQRRLQLVQRDILEQKANAGVAQKQEREMHKQLIKQEQMEAAAETAARADRVRKELQASERRRARSEGARLELGRANFEEKLAREDEQRRANLQHISRMENEEAELIQRLQRSQERHRIAFAQLEDALAGGPGTAPQRSGGGNSVGSSRCPSSLDDGRCTDFLQGTAPSTGSRTPVGASAAVGSRPPRPRASGTPTSAAAAASAASGSGVAGRGRARPTSASRASSVPRLPSQSATRPMGGASKGLTAARDNSTTSICSTASGGPSPESAASGHSTPTAAPISYTTVDGMQLEIAEEEDLDLNLLLSG